MANPPQPGAAAPGWADSAVSIVNGMVGDYLHNSANELAITMACYHRNRPLPLTRAAIEQAHPQHTPHICVLVHGLGCHEGIWSYPQPGAPEQATSYGAGLHDELGYTPFYVRYNTGMALQTNGQQLDALLGTLLAAYPPPVEEIVLIGHSMGGLIIRIACDLAAQREGSWVEHIQRVFYLGTPHDGADLARLSHATARVLGVLPHPITRLVGTVLNQRSQGVKDLNAGTPHIAWLSHAQHYLLIGTLAAHPDHVVSRMFGDGLVLAPPADHADSPAEWLLPIPAEHVQLFPRTNHLRLAHDPAVYQQIKAWCAVRQ